jgi:hypothetical protein
VGSIPTPYIFDDRADFRDAAKQIFEAYTIKTTNQKEWKKRCNAAREWVTSDESMMSSKNMGKNVIKYINQTFDTWEPRAPYDFLKIKELPAKHNKHIISL